jgi:translocation and assembly module TamB
MSAEEEIAPPGPVVRSALWLRRLVLLAVALVGMALMAVLVLDSPIGHRYVADRIASLAPASGLRITVGRIEGSLYGSAKLRDVAFADPQGVFARVPEAELDWRPLSWFRSGLDVRKLVLRRGVLLRLPRLRPGRPDAPILPNFDIRIDRLEIDRLRIAEGVLGRARRVDLNARADIRKGKALIRADGRLGGGDRLFVLLDAEPDRDKFDLKVDYSAPKGGLLAELAGAENSLDLAIGGKGDWRRWDGALLAAQDGQRLAALKLTNRSGRYGVLGLAWPDGLLSGAAARAAGDSVAVAASGTLVNSVLKGDANLIGQGLAVQGSGAADLGRNRFDGLQIKAAVRAPERLIPGLRLEGTRLAATLDGPFRDLTIDHRLTAARVTSGSTRFEGLAQSGMAAYDEAGWRLPLQLTAERIVTGNASFDPRLVKLRLGGTVTLAGTRLAADELALAAPGLTARLVLRGDTARGGYALAGPVAARGLALANLGTADAQGRILFKFGGQPWTLEAQLTGRMASVTNATLTTLAGTGITFAGNVSLGGGRPLLFERATLRGSKLTLALSGRYLPGGGAVLTGRGSQADYGPFTVEANVAGDATRAVLVFADPLPAAGLKDVRVALAPIAGGFRIETSGGSTLGPFTGTLGLFAKPGGPTRIEIERLDVWKTAVRGTLTLGNGAAAGQLTLAGGGVAGTIDLAPREGGQGFKAVLTANDARFGGDNPLTIGTGRLEAQGLLRKGHSSITGSLLGQGIGQGQLFLGRIAASAQLTDGRGQVTASLAGRRGSRFDLQLQADVAPQRIAVAARGQFAGQPIRMPRRAVLTAEADGWRLAPTQIDYAGGRAVASGLAGGRTTDLHLALANMPLSLIDVLVADVGLGGRISGLVDYRHALRSPPTGEFRVKIAGLTRSGLVLTSRPLDLAVVGSLLPDRLETRAVAMEGGEVRGRLQGRIAGLTREGPLTERIQRGALFAQLRYNGPADALWRLAALNTFDLTGPLAVAADATGSVASPTIRDSLASDNLRLQSSLIGTNVEAMKVRGAFAGSRLVLSSLSGQTTGGGTVAGSGSFDLSALGERGPAINLRLSARNARLLAREDMAASLTGPLLIRSDGISGIIAGRLAIDRASWRLGRSAAVEQLPIVKTREINRPADFAPPRSQAAPWRFLIDARGPNRVEVNGMGLESEWSADIRLRGTTAAPEITGRADLVRGSYDFAGKRFDMIRGRIFFDGGSPPDPRLDILAESKESGLTARVSVTGTSLRPDIAFSSIPALPEEELLSRILFGTSITNISAPEALQLGASISALRGGGGLDPINKLRRAIGLDRLRIVPAEVATGRGTGVAAGKYITRRLYAEIVTDGRGYSATQLEFRVTSWLSLLSSVSTVGKQSANVKISKDY